MKNCTPLWREAHLQVKKLKTPHVWTIFGSCDVKKCTPLWREAHLQVKKLKTPHVWTTFKSCDVGKVHAVDGAKHISKSKCTKHTRFGPLLEVATSRKCTDVVARSTFRSQNIKHTPHARTTFWRSDVFLCGRRKGLCTLLNVSKT